MAEPAERLGVLLTPHRPESHPVELPVYGTALRSVDLAGIAFGAAYADVVSEYAALGQDEPREAARAAVPATSDRGRKPSSTRSSRAR